MKRVPFLLLILMLMALVACGGDAAPTTAPSGDNGATDVETEPEPAATQVPEVEESGEVEAPVEDVTIGFGGTIPMSHPGAYVGEVLGFWEEENLNFAVQPNDGSVQSIQLLEAGQVDVAQITPETLVSAQGEGIDAVAIYSVNRYSNRLCTSTENRVDDISELAGTRVGIPSATSGQVFFVRAILEGAGLDPDSDVEMVPTGFGPAAAENLASGDVSAVGYWGGWFIQARGLGYEFDCHELPGMEASPGHVLVAMRETVENRPDYIERVGRAYAKSIQYALSHPEGTVQAYWTLYPEAKVVDVPEDELLASSAQEVESYLEDFVFHYDGWMMGHNNPEGWQALVDFMVNTGQIEQSVAAEQIITNDFVEAYNDFDAAAIDSLPDP